MSWSVRCNVGGIEANMAELNETVRGRLIVAATETLLFGCLLAIFGYILDGRLEGYKHELAGQSEKTKILLASLEPDLQLRRTAYAEYRKAARAAKLNLEAYYNRADNPPVQVRRDSEIASLRGLSGGSSSWAPRDDAVVAIERLAELRNQYDDVASDEINAVVDAFIDSLVVDLKASAVASNDSTGFHNAAVERLGRGFGLLKGALDRALGIDQLPVK